MQGQNINILLRPQVNSSEVRCSQFNRNEIDQTDLFTIRLKTKISKSQNIVRLLKGSNQKRDNSNRLWDTKEIKHNRH